jgi:uncharacterized phage protein gp47/JayE
MAVSIDSTGINIDNLSDRIDELNTDLRSIYGENINLDQDTPDGQMVGIYSKLDIDSQESLVEIYNSRDPDTAVGVSLDVISKLSGLLRNPPTKSTVSIDVATSQDNVVLPDGYTISDSNNQNWVIDTETTILTAGTQSVDFSAQNFGSLQALANTITTPVTIVIGVDSVTNPLDSTVGLDEETDEALRLRRARGTEKPSKSSIGSILASLLNDVQNVTDAVVYENKTDTYDPIRGINARTIWAVVEGGTDGDIAESLIKQKTIGADFKGSSSGEFSEVIQKPDGGSRTIVNTANFDRPTLTNIYIRVTLTKKNATDVIDEQAVKNALILKTFTINEDLTVTELYGNVYQGGTNFTASLLEVSKDDITYENELLDADFDEKFVITDGNIQITVL